MASKMLQAERFLEQKWCCKCGSHCRFATFSWLSTKFGSTMPAFWEVTEDTLQSEFVVFLSVSCTKHGRTGPF